jgi:hypothetical protein
MERLRRAHDTKRRMVAVFVEGRDFVSRQRLGHGLLFPE